MELPPSFFGLKLSSQFGKHFSVLQQQFTTPAYEH